MDALNDLQLSEADKKELMFRIKEEWDKRPHWSFAHLMGEMNYIAVGHTDISASRDRALLKAFRQGYHGI